MLDVEARLLAVETFAATIGFKRLGRVPAGAISLPDMELAEARDQAAGEEGRNETESEADAVQSLIDRCIGQL